MRGSECATASSASVIGRSGSYFTSIRSSAAVAISSLTAATPATGSPTKRTLSRARACSSWLTGRIPKGIGRSLPVSTAFTPARAWAREVSIRVMRAWGWGLRSSLAYSMRGRKRSSEKRVGGEQEGGCTVSALRGAELGKGVLQRMQRPTPCHPLDGFDVPPGAREAEHQTGKHGLPVHQHGAGAALAQLAAVFRAGETQVFAQHFQQRLVGREGDFDGLAVQLEGQLDLGVGHPWKPNLDNPEERRQLSGSNDNVGQPDGR